MIDRINKESELEQRPFEKLEKRLSDLEERMNVNEYNISGFDFEEYKTLFHRFKELEKKLECVWLRTEELNAEDLNIKARIEKLEKEVFDVNNDSRIDESLSASDQNSHELSELEKKLDAWIDDIRIGNKHRFALKEQIIYHKGCLNELQNNKDLYKEVLRDFFEAFDKKHGSHFLKKLEGERKEYPDGDSVVKLVKGMSNGCSLAQQNLTEITSLRTKMVNTFIDEKAFVVKEIDSLKDGCHEAIHRTIVNKEVLRELNQIVKGINYDLSINKIFKDIIYNHYSERLAKNEKKLDGDSECEHAWCETLDTKNICSFCGKIKDGEKSVEDISDEGKDSPQQSDSTPSNSTDASNIYHPYEGTAKDGEKSVGHGGSSPQQGSVLANTLIDSIPSTFESYTILEEDNEKRIIKCNKTKEQTDKIPPSIKLWLDTFDYIATKKADLIKLTNKNTGDDFRFEMEKKYLEDTDESD